MSAIKPISVDLAAAKRWWQAPIESGGDWRSEKGFHVNGVDDAFKLSELKSGDSPYVFYLFQPAATSQFDFVAPIFYDGKNIYYDYGHAVAPTFTSDGRVKFEEVGKILNPPTTGPAAESIKLLYEASGFYLIQTSETTYDMVSAKDAKAWITWE